MAPGAPEMAAAAVDEPQALAFDRSGCSLLANAAEATAPPEYREAHPSVRVRITRSTAGVLLGSGGKDEERFTQKGAKHEQHLQVLLPSGECLLSARLHSGTQHCRLGPHTYVWTPDAVATASGGGADAAGAVSRAFQFNKASDCADLAEAITAATHSGAAASQFGSTRADSSADHYFHYYGQLMFQQNMLSDSVRTQLYRRAVFENQIDFRGKVVVDVGCGSGILSFFAAQAGARKVYAIEASRAAIDAELLVSRSQRRDQLLLATLSLARQLNARPSLCTARCTGEIERLRRCDHSGPWESRGGNIARGL